MATPEPEQKNEPKRKPKIRANLFNPYEPPNSIGFPPVQANLTAYELVAFLPNSLRSAQVVHRFASNGVTCSAIWAMVNTARDLLKEWRIDLCGTAFMKTMEDAGLEGWALAIHDQWKSRLDIPWDQRDINVGGFLTFAEMHGKDRSKEVMPFKDLALSVRTIPQGNDALDLTRMVLHCVNNPGEGWMYPRDFDKLLTHLGGPRPISEAHLDGASFARWNTFTPPPHRIWSAEEIEASKELAQSKWKKKKNSDGLELATPMPGAQAPDSIPDIAAGVNKRGRLSRHARIHTATPMPEARPQDFTPGIAAQLKTRGWLKKRVILDTANLEAEDAEQEQEGGAHKVKHKAGRSATYKRAIARYITPPEHVTPPTLTAVYFAFCAEHDVDETDPFSAYAFGGPRHEVPFRMLCDIQEPNTADISGWAENLRWAAEQYKYFGDAMDHRGWNESPLHMERIAYIRQQSIWASFQLLEHLNNSTGRKKSKESKRRKKSEKRQAHQKSDKNKGRRKLVKGKVRKYLDKSKDSKKLDRSTGRKNLNKSTERGKLSKSTGIKKVKKSEKERRSSGGLKLKVNKGSNKVLHDLQVAAAEVAQT